MRAPRTGPEQSPHSMGGPAWRSMPFGQGRDRGARRDDRHEVGPGAGEGGQGGIVGGGLAGVGGQGGEGLLGARQRRVPVDPGDGGPLGGDGVGEEADAGGGHHRVPVEQAVEGAHGFPPVRRAARRAAAALPSSTEAPASTKARAWRSRSWGSPAVPHSDDHGGGAGGR